MTADPGMGEERGEGGRLFIRNNKSSGGIEEKRRPVASSLQLSVRVNTSDVRGRDTAGPGDAFAFL